MKNNYIETDSFALDSEEFHFVQSKPFKTRLPFAVMLKFFRLENRFPINGDNISSEMTQVISLQLNAKLTLLDKHDWENRTSERFRQEIRKYFGYRQATIDDSERLIDWLIAHVLPDAPTIPQSCEKANQFFRENKLECFTPRELERYVWSASHQYERRVLSNVFSQLSMEAINLIDSLLNDVVAGTETDVTDDILDIKLRHIKKDIAGAKLKNVAFEIDKINRIRSISLPVNLLDTFSRKLLQKYYMRIMAELPSNIKGHDPEVRYATMAAFLYIRSQLLTDNLADVLTQLIQKL